MVKLSEKPKATLKRLLAEIDNLPPVVLTDPLLDGFNAAGK